MVGGAQILLILGVGHPNVANTQSGTQISHVKIENLVFSEWSLSKHVVYLTQHINPVFVGDWDLLVLGVLYMFISS